MPLKRSAGNAMPGRRYLLDTNALVALLQGNQELLNIIESAEWIGLSVINVLEFLGFEGLTTDDQNLLSTFVSRVNVVSLNYDDQLLMAKIISLRQSKALKLPDAIVVASAAVHHAILLTNDSQVLSLADRDSSYPARGFAASS